MNWIKRFGPLILVALAVAAVIASGLGDHLSLAELKARRDQLQGFVALHPVLSFGLYILIYIAVVSLSLPGALVMTLSGGFLFGPWLGAAAASSGASLGAAVIFLVCRTAVGDSLRGKAGSTISRIEEGVRRDAFSYILTLRLIPAIPFWLVNLAAGFVNIPLRTFLAATVLGILPGSLVYSGLGAGLGEVFASGQEPNLRVIFEPHVLLPLVGLGLLSLLPVVLRRFRKSGDAA
jgi:uncharacterized membrane protein YdjX (TVP38/TMEM64 family)